MKNIGLVSNSHLEWNIKSKKQEFHTRCIKNCQSKIYDLSLSDIAIITVNEKKTQKTFDLHLILSILKKALVHDRMESSYKYLIKLSMVYYFVIEN